MRKLNPAFGATFFLFTFIWQGKKSDSFWAKQTKQTLRKMIDQSKYYTCFDIMQLFIDNFQVPAQSYVN